MSVGLHIKLEEIENRMIFRLDGRLDAATAPILDKKVSGLIDENRHYLLLDFSSVDYLSSAGMRVLLSATKKLKEKKGTLLLFSMSDDLLDLIKMAGFDKILHIFASERDALHFNS